MSIRNKSRRDFLVGAGHGIGALSLAGAFGSTAFAKGSALPAALPAVTAHLAEGPLAPRAPHFAPKAKSVIWLHMAGAPSTIDLFDYKPDLVKLSGQEVPQSFLKGVRTTTQGGVGKVLETGRDVEAIWPKRRMVLGPAAEPREAG